ncbi:hypothetical protein [Veronia nyctiphanis]|uniref:hypothetical protein n=1 Tax=Veronia nyctiphanis TaxID=1278244 RepID=UPI00100C35BE|nr:hypothetical protein [Veronia nyctiphanis]
MKLIIICIKMSFIAILPIWLGAQCFYLSSRHQVYIETAITKFLGLSSLILGFVSGCWLFSLHYPNVSALLASVVVLMLSLILNTLLAPYFKNARFANSLVAALLLSFGALSYVV